MTVTAWRTHAAAPVGALGPQATPTPPDREPTSGASAHPFAELLRQNRTAETTPAEAPRTPEAAAAAKPETSPGHAGDSVETTVPTDASPKSEAGRARARSGAASRSPARQAAAERPVSGTDRVPQRESQEDIATATPADADAANPDVAARPDAPRPDATRAADAELQTAGVAQAQQGSDTRPRGPDADASAESHGTDSARAVVANNTRQKRLDTDPARLADAARNVARGRADAAEAPAARFAQALAETKAQDRAAAAGSGADRSPLAASVSAVLHEPSPQAAPGSDAASLASTLPVPVDSPEFASAFGVQVSVFARDGVQHAELHLNPAEMGPVSIAITLDGSQARVEFGADLAATRQAIENGLPELASALRDAGFTLAGGGVAQHSRSGGGQSGDDPAGRAGQRRGEARRSEALEATVQRTTHRIAAGRVDVYA